MAKKLIYLIQERPRNGTGWQCNEAFEIEDEAIKAKLLDEQQNPEYIFKVIQLPFTPKE